MCIVLVVAEEETPITTDYRLLSPLLFSHFSVGLPSEVTVSCLIWCRVSRACSHFADEEYEPKQGTHMRH